MTALVIVAFSLCVAVLAFSSSYEEAHGGDGGSWGCLAFMFAVPLLLKGCDVIL